MLRITEIFFSLQGETRTVGIPTVFVRLTGCPLRCNYCDTTYAFQGGKILSLENIIAQVNQYKARYVTVTGGEPLAQPNVHILLSQLCDLGYEVSLETSGALDVSQVDSRVVKVIDIKTPGSRESKKNLWRNLEFVFPQDQIKFVICNQADYQWSKDIVKMYELDKKCQILFSASYDELSSTELANWIIADSLPVRLQIQLHKYLWGNVAGR